MSFVDRLSSAGAKAFRSLGQIASSKMDKGSTAAASPNLSHLTSLQPLPEKLNVSPGQVRGLASCACGGAPSVSLAAVDTDDLTLSCRLAACWLTRSQSRCGCTQST